MSQKCVSVIIPCFNRSEVVARAIKSVLQQTHADFEVIIVDDASTDGGDLARTIREIGDRRFKLVKHERNLGGGAARNTGVANAVGDYVAFLDSDDEWLPRKLEQQLSWASEQAEKRWLIYSQSIVITTQESGEHRSLMPLHAIKEGERVGDYLFRNSGWLPTPAMFLPTELAREVPFNPELSRHQDYDFLLRLEAAGCRFLMVSEPLVVVHWEDLHQSGRGLDPANSLAFLRDYRNFLSPAARSGFLFGQVVMRLLRARRRLAALRFFVQHVRPWHLGPVQHVSLLSAVVFGDARVARALAGVKRRLRGGAKSVGGLPEAR